MAGDLKNGKMVPFTNFVPSYFAVFHTLCGSFWTLEALFLEGPKACPLADPGGI